MRFEKVKSERKLTFLQVYVRAMLVIALVMCAALLFVMPMIVSAVKDVGIKHIVEAAWCGSSGCAD